MKIAELHDAILSILMLTDLGVYRVKPGMGSRGGRSDPSKFKTNERILKPSIVNDGGCYACYV